MSYNNYLMSVWKSDEELLIFASLIAPPKIMLFENKYQALNTAFILSIRHLKDVKFVKNGSMCIIFLQLSCQCLILR